jgi:molybdopterin-containing oxidoreductase family membrane subunit
MRVDISQRNLMVPLGIVWAVALGVGAFGIFQLVSEGHKMTETGSYIPWGLWVALYIFLVESAAGMHLASTLGTVYRWKPFVRILKLNLFLSFIFGVGGLSLIWMDLGRPERLWELYLRPGFSSPMNWMAWIYLVFMVLQIVQLSWEFRADRRRARLGPLSPAEEEQIVVVRRQLGLVGVPTAVALSTGVGFLVGNPSSQLFYQVGLYPVHFLATALASGAGVLALVSGLVLARRDEEMRNLAIVAGRIALAGVAFEALFILFDFFISTYGGVPRLTEAVEAVLTGTFAWSFWLFQVAIGMVIPFLILVTPRLSSRPNWIGAAGFMIALGFVVVRINTVLPAFVAPQLEGLQSAFVESGLSYDYFPGATEWFVAMFVGAILIGLFYLGFRLLPLVGEPEEVK